MKDDFIRLVKTQWIAVDNNELKNYALVQAIMFAMIFLCISGGIILFLRLDFLKVFYLFCGVFLTACMAFLIFSKREWFDEHYGLTYNGYEVGYRDFEDRLSYEAVVLMLLVAMPALTSMFFVCGLYFGNIIVAVSELIAIPIPFILMFLRIKAYENKIVINLNGQIDFFPILYLNFGLFNAMAGIAFSIAASSAAGNHSLPAPQRLPPLKPAFFHLFHSPSSSGQGKSLPKAGSQTPNPANYFAYSMARLSRTTCTFTWPG